MAGFLEHASRVLIEVTTDFAAAPSLLVVFNRGRHFEFFIGFLHFIASLLYNVTDSLEIELFLGVNEWHELTNVAGITYGLFLAIFLMQNRQERFDNVLRYAVFAIVWICQLKDRYWMDATQYTLWFCVVFCLFAVVKFVSGMKRMRFSKNRLIAGGVSIMFAAGFFILSLDDEHDTLRWKHGVAQAFAGIALFNLWQITASTVESYDSKRGDEVLPGFSTL